MDPSESQNLRDFKIVKNSDGSETVHYSAFWEGTPNEIKTIAERELGETPEKVSKGMKCLKMYSEEKGLPKTDDVYLMAILRNSKYDLKKSKGKLEKFLRVRELIAEKVAELDMNKVDKILNDTFFTILPYRDKHRRVIFMTKPTMDLEAYSINDGFICFFALVFYWLSLPMSSLYGIAYIAESKTPSVSLMYQILMGFKTWLKTALDLPLSLRKIEIMNESVLVRWFLNIARHLMAPKIFKRITLHGDNLEKLKNIYHPDLLPEELGGNLGPANTKIFRQKLLDFMQKLKEEHRAKTADK